MNIVAATQQFAVQGHSILHSGRLERASNHSEALPSAAAQSKTPTTTTTTTNIMPQLRQSWEKTTPTAQKATETPSNESTSSAAQNEDKQSLNELQAVDAVERILDQLSTGKLLSWIDGSSLEKIQAQLTEQQRASSSLTTDMPAFSAQSMVTSFGLDDSEALLNRISRSGIFSDAPLTAFNPAAQMHVDLNI